MTFDGPAQHAIREFLALHRLQPGRSTRERLLGRSPLGESTAQWYWTAVGQLEVVAKLDRLGHEWSVLHGLPGAAGTDGPALIDHLVIGPAGVFAVNAYNHARQNVLVSRRAFVVEGHHLQYIRQAEAAIGQVERMLEASAGHRVRASTIIVVIDPGSLQVRGVPRDVFVVEAASLPRWLKARDRELGAAAVAELTALAHLGTTWEESPGSAAETAPETGTGAIELERAQFENVRREVAAARIVRAVWAIGIVALLAGALVAVGILQLVAARS